MRRLKPTCTMEGVTERVFKVARCISCVGDMLNEVHKLMQAVDHRLSKRQLQVMCAHTCLHLARQSRNERPHMSVQHQTHANP